MAYVPKGEIRGKKGKIRVHEIEADELTLASSLTLGTTDALTVDTINAISGKHLTLTGADGYDVIVKLGDDDGNEEFRIQEVDGDNIFYVDSDKKIKLLGEVSTRNTADSSMYYSIPASLAHERGMIAAFDVVANDGGYFDALYANVRSGGITGGELRAIEAKASVAHDMSAGATATGVYAKVAVANACEVATAIGVDVLLEETGTGAITKGIGVRVQGGVGAIDYAVDSGGLYRLGALKIPAGSAGSISAANLATGFGITEGAVVGDDAIIGLYTDTGDGNAISLVVKAGGLYKYIKLTDAS